MNKTKIISFPDLQKAARRQMKNIPDIREANKLASPRLKEYLAGKSYCLFTSGCQANVRDSEIIKAYLDNLNMKQIEDVNTASLILFNTCAIRENAETKIYGELGHLKPLALNDKDKIIGICGCMAQEEKPITYIKEKFPFVRLIFGTHNIDDIYSLLDEVIFNDERLIDVPSIEGSVVENYPSTRFEKYKAFVNIMYGCDNFCTYCIVPYTRGRQRSRSIESVVNEVISLKEQGYKEVTLLGQNVNAYGVDLKDENITFAKLLEEVAKTGIERVRFTTSHPAYFTLDVFDVMAKYPNIMKALHLPLQSGSDNILLRMNRHYTNEKYLYLVDELRKRIPDIYLTTDIIVGFPNETDEDFEKTIELCNKVKFDNAFTFIYSKRDGTPAAKMQDKISDKTKSERFSILQQTIDKYATINAQNMVNKTVEVLFDGVSKRDKNMISGYDNYFHLVHVKADPSIIGKILKVKIVSSHTYSLIGEICD